MVSALIQFILGGFAIAKPSIDLKEPDRSGPSFAEPSNGNPSADGDEPMQTEASSKDEGEAMQIDEAPLSQDWRDLYLD